MSNCLLNFVVHSHDQSPVYVCVCLCDVCCSRHCGASLSASHHGGPLSVHGVYSFLCTCPRGCVRAFSPAPGHGVCSFSRGESHCGGCAACSGRCPLCAVASPRDRCIDPLDVCSLWPRAQVGQMIQSSCQGTVTEVQEEHTTPWHYPESMEQCDSAPGVEMCWEGGQLGNRSYQVPEAAAAPVGKMQRCCTVGQLVPLLSHAGTQRPQCEGVHKTALVVLDLKEYIRSKLPWDHPGACWDLLFHYGMT